MIQAPTVKYVRSAIFRDVTQCVVVIPNQYELLLLINNQLTDVLEIV
jgi:hypothetical protein